VRTQFACLRVCRVVVVVLAFVCSPRDKRIDLGTSVGNRTKKLFAHVYRLRYSLGTTGKQKKKITSFRAWPTFRIVPTHGTTTLLSSYRVTTIPYIFAAKILYQVYRTWVHGNVRYNDHNNISVVIYYSNSCTRKVLSNE